MDRGEVGHAMKHTWIAVVMALIAARGADAASIVVGRTNPLVLEGAITTVTVTLTTFAGEVVPQFGAFGVTIGWDPEILRVAGSDGVTTFGKSAQSPILPGLSGSLTPACASSGVNKGKACAVISQVALAQTVLAGGQVVIGTLLLELLDPADWEGNYAFSGLHISSYNNNGVTNPGSDANLYVSPEFNQCLGIPECPEPTTAALLGLGLVGFGLRGRRRHA